MRLNFAVTIAASLLTAGLSHAQSTDRASEATPSSDFERSGQASRFSLCAPDCANALFYVADNLSNSATAADTTSRALRRSDRVLRNVGNLGQVVSLPQVDRRRAGTPGADYADSAYEISANKVGFSKKSETIIAASTTALSDARAGVKLYWGDSFLVTSATLSPGTLVNVEVRRVIGGSGDVSDYSFYASNSETYINRNKIVALNYSFSKAPNGLNVETGVGDVVHVVRAKVGELVSIEGLLEVTDGVAALANSTQFLNGASDSVAHSVTLSTAHAANACLRSASGAYRSGNCP